MDVALIRGHRVKTRSETSPGLEKEGLCVPCRHHIDEALELSSRLIELANEPRETCDHDGCLVLDGVLLDCALEIRRTATLRRYELSPEPLVASFGRSTNSIRPTHNGVENLRPRHGTVSSESKEEKR
jgi:hypothetical protein